MERVNQLDRVIHDAARDRIQSILDSKNITDNDSVYVQLDIDCDSERVLYKVIFRKEYFSVYDDGYVKEDTEEKVAINLSDTITTPLIMASAPLEMIWQPKEDITTYELAMCLPYFFNHRGIMPYEIDTKLPYLRHFKIINHNNG